MEWTYFQHDDFVNALSVNVSDAGRYSFDGIFCLTYGRDVCLFDDTCEDSSGCNYECVGDYYVRYEDAILILYEDKENTLLSEQIGVICDKLELRQVMVWLENSFKP